MHLGSREWSGPPAVPDLQGQQLLLVSLFCCRARLEAGVKTGSWTGETVPGDNTCEVRKKDCLLRTIKSIPQKQALWSRTPQHQSPASGALSSPCQPESKGGRGPAESQQERPGPGPGPEMETTPGDRLRLVSVQSTQPRRG